MSEPLVGPLNYFMRSSRMTVRVCECVADLPDHQAVQDVIGMPSGTVRRT